MAASSPLDNRIVVHHVGGRGLTVAFFVPPAFADDVRYVLYEADADAVAKSSEQAGQLGNMVILPYALGAREENRRLHITANPYGSSLYEPSPDFARHYCEVRLSGMLDGVSVQDACYDAFYGNENRVVRIVDIETHSLDGLKRAGKLPPGCDWVDVLTLDTQGAEPEILDGAAEILAGSVLAVMTEISFHRMYVGQPPFSAVLDRLDRLGFLFAGFSEMFETSSYRGAVGLRAKGFASFGDAVFLRRLETLEEMFPDPAARLGVFYKLAFISLKLGYMEYALEALEAAGRLGSPTEDAKKRLYIRLLGEIERAARQMNRRLCDDRTQVAVKLRRERGYERLSLSESGGHLVEMPEGRILARRFYCQPESKEDKARREAERDLPSPVEGLLAAHGFETLAEHLKQRRLAVDRLTFAEDPRKALRLVLVAGDAFEADAWAQQGLAALASKGNLQALCATWRVDMVMVLPSGDMRRIRLSPAFAELRKLVDLTLVACDDLPGDRPAMRLRGLAYAMPEQPAYETAVVIDGAAVLNPDTLEAVAAAHLQGQAAVAVGSVASDAESAGTVRRSVCQNDRILWICGFEDAADCPQVPSTVIAVSRIAPGRHGLMGRIADLFSKPQQPPEPSCQKWVCRVRNEVLYNSHGCTVHHIPQDQGLPNALVGAAIMGGSLALGDLENRVKIRIEANGFSPNGDSLVLLLYDPHDERGLAMTTIPIVAGTQAAGVLEYEAEVGKEEAGTRFFQVSVGTVGNGPIYLNGDAESPFPGLVCRMVLEEWEPAPTT